MYEVSVKKHFDAAHYLRGYGGKCEDLHGHRFEVAVFVEAEKLNDIDIAFDFAVLKKHLGDVLSRFDHVCLNDIPPFERANPSSENIARIVYEELLGRLSGIAISRVEVWESPDSKVAFIP